MTNWRLLSKISNVQSTAFTPKFGETTSHQGKHAELRYINEEERSTPSHTPVITGSAPTWITPESITFVGTYGLFTALATILDSATSFSDWTIALWVGTIGTILLIVAGFLAADAPKGGKQAALSVIACILNGVMLVMAIFGVLSAAST